MLIPIIISFFALVTFFLFYHFKFGMPEDFANFRIAMKYLIFVAFWAFFVYMNFVNLWSNTYSHQQGEATQRMYLQQESGSEFEYFTVFLRNKQLVHKSDKPFYNWQIYYSSKYYDVLPDYRYRASFLDTLEIKYDKSKYDRMMILTNRDSIFAGSIALEFQNNPILLFSPDLKTIVLKKIKMDFSHEISLIILFLTAIMASLYHIIKIKTPKIRTFYKYLFYIIMISWSGVNIYQISKPILEFLFNLA